MKETNITLLFMLCVFIFSACSKDDAEGTDLHVGTYNAGIARGYVDYAAERMQPQIEALRMVDDLDILCLQEVWAAEDRRVYREALSEIYPHAFDFQTTNETLFGEEEGTGEAPCNMEEAQALADCANPACGDDDDLTSCVLSNCRDEFDALSPGCQTCAAGNIGLNDVDAIVNACITETLKMNSYEGENGLLLLSKFPIQNARFERLSSFLTTRGILLADIEGIKVGCTHLTARLSNPVYNGEYLDYESENAAQVERVMALMTTENTPAVKVLLGDFNNGPAVGDLSAELPENFSLFTENGWRSDNVEGDVPECTWCADNLITGGSANEAIDHILVLGGHTHSSNRFLIESVEVTRDEMMFMTSYSDHYGVSAWVGNGGD